MNSHTRRPAASLAAGIATSVLLLATRVGAGTPCAPIEALEQGTGDPIPWCSAGPTPAPTVVCPPASEIAVVIDNDFESAKARGPGSKLATDWRNLVTDLMSLSIVCSSGTSDPMRLVPGGCGTIQGRRLDACRSANRLFPAGLAGESASTPAVEAVRWLGTLLTTQRRGVVVLAFDGVVDGNYEAAPPAVAFGRQVAELVRQGLAVGAVVQPSAYRYVWIVARPQYAGFVPALAAALEAKWAVPDAPAVALIFSQNAYLQSGRRVETAAAGVRRVPVSGPHWDNSLPQLYRRKASDTVPERAWQAEISRWVTQQSTVGSAFSLTWEASLDRWRGLAPFGTLVPPPTIQVNRALEDADPATTPWSRSRDVAVGTLDGCAEPRLGVSAAIPFHQSLLVRTLANLVDLHGLTGRADLTLFRGRNADLDWVTQLRPFGPGDSPLFLFQRRGWLDKLARTSGPPLVAMSLVSPAVSQDPCLAALQSRVRNSYRWQVSDETSAKLGELPADCGGEPWSRLLAGFNATASRRFGATRSGPFSAYDARVAIETFLEAAVQVNLLARSDPAAQACVLQTFRVTVEPAISSAVWRRQ